MAKSCCETRKIRVPFVIKQCKLLSMMEIHIHCRYASAKDSTFSSAIVYRHTNMIKEMMKFGSLPKGRFVMNSKYREPFCAWEMWPRPHLGKPVGSEIQHTGPKPTDRFSCGESGLHCTYTAVRLAFAKTPSPWIEAANVY